MSKLTPVDFIAPNVNIELMITDNNEWIEATIVKVLDRDEDDIQKFVKCEVIYKDGDDREVTLSDGDYDIDSPSSWRFSSTFSPLIEQIMHLKHMSETEEEQTETNEEETDSDSDVFEIYRNKPSNINKALGILFGMSPWIATMVVLYNARYDICRYFHEKYC